MLTLERSSDADQELEFAETINNDFTFAVHAVVMPTLSLMEMSRRMIRH